MADQATDAFSSDPSDEEIKNKPAPEDVFVEKLMAITDSEGRPKYDSIEKALDALAHSQAHIKQLEAEQTLNREALAQAKTFEDIVKKLGNGNVTEQEKPPVETPPSGGLSEEQAAELVRKIINGEKQTDAALKNLTKVNDTLISKFGDKTREVVATKAKELGTTPQQLKELSASNPEMVLALFGGTSGSPSATISSVNLGSFKPKDDVVSKPAQSLISGPGATDKKRAEYMAQIKANVYKRMGVTT